MSIRLSTRVEGVGAQRPGHDGVSVGRAGGRRERGLRWACVFMHLLAGCAFAVAGAYACEFVLLTSFKRGAFFSLLLYAAVAAAIWLAAGSGADF